MMDELVLGFQHLINHTDETKTAYLGVKNKQKKRKMEINCWIMLRA